MEKTTNYQLPKWEKSDFIKMDDFNDAFGKLDAALKASDVEMTTFFAPPSETNFAGGLLTGTQSACLAACEAFADAVQAVAAAPLQ